MKTRVKICGLRRAEDAELAVELGASLVGVVRAATSPRRARLEEARQILDRVSDRARTVVVFKGVSPERILSETMELGADAAQIYDLDPEALDRLEGEGLAVMRVHRIEALSQELPALVPFPSRDRPAILDVAGGGAGRSFDWALLGGRAPEATFIAGGIRPDNVERLLAHRPYGLDLSSGVESEPGVKDASKLRELFRRIRDHEAGAHQERERD